MQKKRERATKITHVGWSQRHNERHTKRKEICKNLHDCCLWVEGSWVIGFPNFFTFLSPVQIFHNGHHLVRKREGGKKNYPRWRRDTGKYWNFSDLPYSIHLLVSGFWRPRPECGFVGREFCLRRTRVHTVLRGSSDQLSAARQHEDVRGCLWYACVCVLGHVWLFGAPWTVAHQAPLSMDFLGKSTWVGCNFLLQGIFPT